MSETSAPATPGPAETAAPSSAAADPLAGDWSQGLPGPRRPHGIRQPTLLVLNGATPAPPPADPAPPVDSAPPADFAPPAPVPAPLPESAPTPWSEAVPSDEVADANWVTAVPSPPAATSETPPDPFSPVEVTSPPEVASQPEAAPPSETSWEPGAAPPSEVTWQPEATPSPEAPWQAEAAPPPEAVAAPENPWSEAAPAETVQEWQAEEPAADFEEVQAPQNPDVPSAAADWSTLSTGPDWATSAAAADVEIPSADVWGAPPPAAAESEWSSAVPESAAAEWAPPEAASAPDWSAPTAPEWPAAAEAPPPAPAPAWNAPALGASALEQLESEPVEAEPGAAAQLFGTVPTGAMLAGDDDGMGAGPDLASPEEESFAVTIDHEDPDLPEAVDEKGAAPKPHAKPLAAFRPPAQTALEVRGEHRVAVHTRGGRTLRGSVRDVDLSKSQFALLPQGGTGAETIYHSDVKAIFFMLAPGERARGGDGGKVRVTFADGRVIEGIRDGADAKHGFFLVPFDAARTNTRRIYIAREATSDIKDG